MTEISILERTSKDLKRRSLSIVEEVNRNGVTAKAEKRYTYHIFEKETLIDEAEVPFWLNAQAQHAHDKNRHVHVMRLFDPKSGVGQMTYRVIGSFYVIRNLHVFTIVFSHTIRFNIFSI